MRITFGLALDGFRSAAPYFNHLYCGLQGLASALEARLGLVRPPGGNVSRIRQYLDTLASSPRTRFFSNSLARDKWGTAAALLNMRDELRMAGWDGTAPDGAPPRLQDLADIEQAGKLDPGLPDRLAAIRAALPPTNNLVSEIRCVDRQEFLPFQVRTLLAKLGAFFPDDRHGGSQDNDLAKAGTNLRLVQDCLLGRDLAERKWNPDDRSVILATAFSEISLAHAAIHLLQQAKEEAPTLLSSSVSGPLPEVLTSTQSPSPALDSISPLRPVAQILRLTLELIWEPPDPKKLIQFLSHPICPVTRALRAGLASVVSNQPGMGSKFWNEAIQELKDRIRANEKFTAEEKDRNLARIDRDLSDWINGKRYSRHLGVPGHALAEVVRKIEKWATGRAASGHDESMARHFFALAATASDLAGAVDGPECISPEELDIILDQLSSSGTVSDTRVSELGSPRFLGNPGAAVEPAGTLIWWGFEKQRTGIRKTWSPDECRFFEENDIFPQAPESLLGLEREHSLRPFLSTRQQLVLLWPRQRGSQTVEAHPLKILLDTKLGKIPVLDFDNEEYPLPKADRQPQSLPRKKRWIRLPATGALDPRKNESYSSLSKLVFRPIDWVFQYKAKLQRGNLIELNLPAQRGNLLHRVVERLMEPECPVDWRTIGKTEFDVWMESLWPALLATEGANYLLPGSQIAGQRLLEDARLAVWDLIVHMKHAGVTEAQADVTMAPIPIRDASIGGIIDLLVKKKDGSTGVIDLKFGQGKSKRRELETNTALQLAIYGMLIKSQSGQWPGIAYYILRNRTLLTQDQSFFPDSTICECSGPAGPKSIWTTFLDVWQWRLKQISEGWVEFPDPETESTDGSTEYPSSLPPHPEWILDEDAVRYDDFGTLTGWNKEQ